MDFQPGQFYHVYNRSNNQEIVFKKPANYLFFLEKMNGLKNKQPIAFLGYCLMPTHFHWLIRTDQNFQSNNEFNTKIGSVLSSYTQALNRQTGRRGSLFQSETKAKRLYDETGSHYADRCLHYIHQNPLRAGLVESLSDWPYSSYLDFAGIRNGKLPEVQEGYRLFNFNNIGDFINKSDSTIDDRYRFFE